MAHIARSLTHPIFMALLLILSEIFVVSDLAQPALTEALDYDADGKADAAVFRSSDNSWKVQLSDGGDFSTPFGIASSDFLVPGSYDGDRYADLAVWRDTDGTFHYLRSSDSSYVTVQFGQTDDEPIARDYDGDGKTDLAVARRENGSIIWYIWQSTTGAVDIVNFGLSIDFLAPGDYDGDGKFDIAVYRPSPNNGQAIFHVLRSAQGYTSFVFGLSNDLVVPGDYDGDEKTDAAVVRDTGSGLVWYIWRSSDGNVSVVGFGLGGGGDFPVQGDYDGDGKADIAIWRSSDGVYWILKSSDGGVLNKFWGMDGDFPVAYYDVH